MVITFYETSFTIIIEFFTFPLDFAVLNLKFSIIVDNL